MISTLLQLGKHSTNRWSPAGFIGMLHSPHFHQKLPQCVRESQGWSFWPAPCCDLDYNCLITNDVCEWKNSCYNLPEGEFSIFNGQGHAHLQDCHSKCIDIRILRRKTFHELTSKSKFIGEKQLWRHPPSRTPYYFTSGPASWFTNNRGISEVRQASTALRIYQDVDLAASFGAITNCTADHELTPLRSPWTIPWSCRYSSPVAAPTSCPNDQCDRNILLSLHSQDSDDCNPGRP